MRSDSRSAEIPILLANTGDWLVGVEAKYVRSIIKPETRESGTFDLAGLLGFPPRQEDSSVQRALVVPGTSSVQHLLVEEVVGTVRLHSLSATRLPKIFERSGAPRWWLGIAWHEGRVVLLIDLPEVFEASEAFSARATP